MNQLYDLVRKNPDPTNKEIVKIFQSHGDIKTLMTNPNQVASLVKELKILSDLENELQVSTSVTPTKPAKPQPPVLSKPNPNNGVGPLSSPDPSDLKKAIERSKADEHARQQHKSKDAEQEARELELAMQMSLLEAENWNFDWQNKACGI